MWEDIWEAIKVFIFIAVVILGAWLVTVLYDFTVAHS